MQTWCLQGIPRFLAGFRVQDPSATNRLIECLYKEYIIAGVYYSLYFPQVFSVNANSYLYVAKGKKPNFHI